MGGRLVEVRGCTWRESAPERRRVDPDGVLSLILQVGDETVVRLIARTATTPLTSREHAVIVYQPFSLIDALGQLVCPEGPMLTVIRASPYGHQRGFDPDRYDGSTTDRTGVLEATERAYRLPVAVARW